MESVLEDNELGRIEIWRNKSARRIKVTIKPNHLRLTLPFHVSQKEGLDFLNEVRIKIKEKQEKSSLQTFIIDENNPLKTLSFTTKVEASKNDKVFFRLRDRVLLIEYPLSKQSNSAEMQTTFRKGIVYFLQKEAKRLLPERIKQLATIHGFSYTAIKIQSSKTRWGSCSTKKNINLSYYLLLMPPPLIDYVLLHELCHTVEMNHGVRFWQLMDKVTDNQTKSFRKAIKEYRCAL